jgi:hypothetical protein
MTIGDGGSDCVSPVSVAGAAGGRRGAAGREYNSTRASQCFRCDADNGGGALGAVRAVATCSVWCACVVSGATSEGYHSDDTATKMLRGNRLGVREVK